MLPVITTSAQIHKTDQQIYRDRAAGLRVCDLASPVCKAVYDSLVNLLDRPLEDDELGERAWTAMVMGTTHY